MTESVPPTRATLESLFRAHATALLRLATLLTGDRHVAEELVQDAFVAFARQAKSPQSGTELAYLRRTVLNLSHGRHRRLALARRHADAERAYSPAAEVDAERRQLQHWVANAVRSLPERQRECIILRCYSEATDSEIAAALNISVGSVKTHLHRARATLAEDLKELR